MKKFLNLQYLALLSVIIWSLLATACTKPALSGAVGGREESATVGVANGEKADEYRIIPSEEAIHLLKDRLEIRDFLFTPQGQPQVTMTLKNPQATNRVSFEIAATFLRESGGVIDRTRWISVELGPRDQYQFIASSKEEASSVQIFFRRIDIGPIKTSPDEEVATEPES